MLFKKCNSIGQLFCEHQRIYNPINRLIINVKLDAKLKLKIGLLDVKNEKNIKRRYNEYFIDWNSRMWKGNSGKDS